MNALTNEELFELVQWLEDDTAEPTDVYIKEAIFRAASERMKQGKVSLELIQKIRAEWAAAYFRGMNQEIAKCPTKEILLVMGRKLWEETYKHTDSDLDAFVRLSTFAVRHPELDISLQLPSNQITCQWSTRWADQAFPQIILGHKYCAALLATGVDADVLVDVHPPWKAFLIELPANFLYTDEEGKPVALTRILVQRLTNSKGELVWNYVANSEACVTLWRHGCSLRDLVADDLQAGCWENCSFVIPINDADSRLAALLGRLIINVCLAMSDPNNVRGPKEAARRSSRGEERSSPHPVVRTYRLGRPITLDCREAIQDYVAGRRRNTPSVQTLVAGHWKRQVHGPGRSLRKLIHIEPFWRGRADAPILVRPHIKET